MGARAKRLKMDDEFTCKVHDLWKKGLPPKAIAIAIGASATSVYRVMRKIYREGGPPAPVLDSPKPPPVSSDTEGAHRTIRAKCSRCNGCGGMVIMPCYLCEVRRVKNKEF